MPKYIHTSSSVQTTATALLARVRDALPVATELEALVLLAAAVVAEVAFIGHPSATLPKSTSKSSHQTDK